jgi:hypothetical protein
MCLPEYLRMKAVVLLLASAQLSCPMPAMHARKAITRHDVSLIHCILCCLTDTP